MRFKVAYYLGSQVEPDTKMSSGRLTISQASLSLSGASRLTIPLTSVTSVELLRPHPRVSLMVRLVAGSTTVCMSALFLKLFWDVFICNQEGTIRLYDALQNRHRALASA
jgi:hypothetical protein